MQEHEDEDEEHLDSDQLEASREASYDPYEDDESDDGFSLEERFRHLEEEVAVLVAGKLSILISVQTRLNTRI